MSISVQSELKQCRSYRHGVAETSTVEFARANDDYVMAAMYDAYCKIYVETRTWSAHHWFGAPLAQAINRVDAPANEPANGSPVCRLPLKRALCPL